MNRPYNIYHRYFPCRSCLSVENIHSSHKQAGQLAALQSFWRYKFNKIPRCFSTFTLQILIELEWPNIHFWGHIIFILILHRYVWSSILCFVYDRNIYKYLSAFSSLILKVTCTAKVCQPDSPQHRQLWWGSTPTWICWLQAMIMIYHTYMYTYT